MTGDAPAARGGTRARQRGRRSWRTRLAVLERRVRRLPTVRAALAVLAAYEAAGGGLAASGLAFGALFAVVPGMLLVVSTLVVLVDDPARRAAIVDWIITQVPPLEDVARAIVEGLADSARLGTVVGAVGLVWGISGFYLALESTMERAFPGTRMRNPWVARIRGVIAVLVIVVGVLVAFLASGVLSFLWRFLPVPGGEDLVSGSAVLAVSGSILVSGLVYRFAPSDHPSFRALLPPAVLTGMAIGGLTAFFGLLAPYLVAGFIGLGVIASVFVALVWLRLVFQFLLYGAALARIRRDRERARMRPVTI